MCSSIELNLSNVLLGLDNVVGRSVKECLPQDRRTLSLGIFSTLGFCETFEIPLPMCWTQSICYRALDLSKRFNLRPDFFSHGWIICAKQDIEWELLSLYLYRKQASLWAHGDIHRSKQRQYEDRSVPHLISSIDNLSISTSIFKSHSLDRMEEVRPNGIFFKIVHLN